MARGAFTLLPATAVTDHRGAAHHGRLTGLLSAPLTVAMALAPFVGAAPAEGVGGHPVSSLLRGAATLAAALLCLVPPPGTP